MGQHDCCMKHCLCVYLGGIHIFFCFVSSFQLKGQRKNTHIVNSFKLGLPVCFKLKNIPYVAIILMKNKNIMFKSSLLKHF